MASASSSALVRTASEPAAAKQATQQSRRKQKTQAPPTERMARTSKAFEAATAEIPDGWSVPRVIPHMADFVYDEKCQFLRRYAPPRSIRSIDRDRGTRVPPQEIQEEDNPIPPGWSCPRYAPHMTQRATIAGNIDPRFQPTRSGPLAVSLEQPLDLGKAEKDVDTPYGWHVKRYNPKMMDYTRDASSQFRLLRPVAPKPKASRLAKPENDVPYGWLQPRYGNAMPTLEVVEDPAARLHGSASAIPRLHGAV